MRFALSLLLVSVAAVAFAQPDYLRINRSTTDPPTKEWANQAANNANVCKAQCGGVSGPTPTNTSVPPTGTITPTPTIPVVLESQYVTNIADVPPEFLSGYTGICALMWTNLIDGNPDLLGSCPGPILKTVMFEDDPCLCSGAGSGSTQVNGTASASADGCLAFGNGASCSAVNCTAVGVNANCSTFSCVALGEGASCDDIGGIAIGKDATANGNSAESIGGHAGEDAQAFGPNSDAAALNSIALGNTARVVSSADAAVCIGANSFCDTEHGLGVGQNASPGGGICFGSGCWSQTGDWTFGGLDQKSHPAWISDFMTVSSCGSGPTMEAYSNDTSGAVTVGTGSITQCVLAFGAVWSSKPSCFAYDETNLVGLRVVTNVAQLTIDSLDGVTTLDGDTIRYGCPVSHADATFTPTATATETATPTATPT